MPKLKAPLSPKRIKALPDGRHNVGHVPGLCVQRDGQARSWLLCYTFGGRKPEMGLGSLSEVDLEEAIEKARAARKLLRDGVDPLDDKRQRRHEIAAGVRKVVTFSSAVEMYLAAHSSAWKNGKHRQQWSNTLETYAEPILGALPVDRIETGHVIRALEPIWRAKTETASRVRQRIESILDFCIAREFRAGPNPARWRGHLENLLPAPAKLAKVEHFAALPWTEIPDFMARLREAEGMGARALEFAVLTAARSGEVRGAIWDEIDLDEALWVIPEGRMKAGKEHKVPLSAPAIKLLRSLPRFKRVPYVFPSPRGTALSDMSLTAVLRRMEIAATAHGMRSSFRDWCAERTNYPREVAEMALAHTISNAVEAAYRRGDLMAKRRRLMADWARYCERPTKSATVTPIRRKGVGRG
jgi:integrase